MKAYAVLFGARGFDRAFLPRFRLPVLGWLRVIEERRRLRELDPRMLRDIGLTRDAVRDEAGRPFWSVNRSL